MSPSDLPLVEQPLLAPNSAQLEPALGCCPAQPPPPFRHRCTRGCTGSPAEELRAMQSIQAKPFARLPGPSAVGHRRLLWQRRALC